MCAMFWRNLVLGTILVTAASSSTQAAEFGRAASQEEIALWDIDVRPDGRGLPIGGGTAARGQVIFEQTCAACHGAGGQGGAKDRLVGGQGTLASAKPVKTVGFFWPYATSLFDYIRRAMPYPDPGSLTADETYAVTAYILSLNAIIPEDFVLSKENLAQVRMPNREGFVPDAEYIHIGNSR
ncbi:c-type cytochrome [Methylobacterium sp. E-046]|uniref:c-type cytochrome n=1 Tax=Methylobacterium sp. E-046 TaxID=2836576 RepID=UPI001FB96DCF|nr:cytochrome c [Methylobacterium sp. E-046]MCJ2098602.1 cytochrome c [Methylobacterium sp. E-046]